MRIVIRWLSHLFADSLLFKNVEDHEAEKCDREEQRHAGAEEEASCNEVKHRCLPVLYDVYWASIGLPVLAYGPAPRLTSPWIPLLISSPPLVEAHAHLEEDLVEIVSDGWPNEVTKRIEHNLSANDDEPLTREVVVFAIEESIE